MEALLLSTQTCVVMENNEDDRLLSSILTAPRLKSGRASLVINCSRGYTFRRNLYQFSFLL